LIDEAAALQPAAANSLLKTLEEPPARTMFVLATTSPDLLLPTIRSRCQRVVFGGASGAGVWVPDDPDRSTRIAQLGDELAAANGGGGAGLAQRIGEGKGDAPLVLAAAAQALHRAAVAQLAAGDPGAARISAERGRRVLMWQQAMIVHNANPQLAVEALVVELAGVVS
jgi:DNA polymerase-3 subunit delta'